MDNKTPTMPEPQSPTPAVNAPEQPKKSYGRNWRKMILIYLAIGTILYAGVYYFILGKQSSKPYSQPVIKTTVSPASSMDSKPTADWKTYEDKSGQYSFQYPAEWNLSSEETANDPKKVEVKLHFTEEGNQYQFMIAQGGSGGPISDKIEDARATYGGKQFTKKTWIKNGKPILISLIPDKADIFNHIEISLPSGNNQKYVSLFDQILSTFKFTDSAQSIDTSDWKTIKSPLSGYTIKYPSDWIAQNDSDVFKNNLGGVSHSLSFNSAQRTGSYDGHDANTYMCVSINEYSVDGWGKTSRNMANFTTLEKFKPNANTQLILSLDKAEKPMLSTLVVSNGSSDYISLTSKYELTAYAQFNCVQGDHQAIDNSKEDFLNRPETPTAREILKSIRFN